jgi:seryl-tRNA synthetase
MATSQRMQSLKFELLIPIYSAERPTACVSFNCHLDHFGEVWELAMADSSTAHTSCVAFGMDRIAVALFRAHGIELEGWPGKVRDTLGL